MRTFRPSGRTNRSSLGSDRETRWPELWAWRVIAVGLLAIAWAVYPGKDAFRPLKDALLRGEAIALVALFVIAVTLHAMRIEWNARDSVMLLVAAVVVWTAFTTVTSTNRSLSIGSLTTVAACAVIFATTYLLGRARSVSALWLLFIAAVPNAVLVLLQEFRIWNPLFSADVIQTQLNTSHTFSTALIGNPDDVGCWFVVPAITAGALVGVDRKRRGIYFLLLALCLTILATGRSITAMIATVVGLMAIAALHSWRHAIVVALTASFALATVIVVYKPLRERVETSAHLMRRGEYDALLTSRGTAFLAAILMAREHPVVGVGPGCFGYHYYPYKLRVESRHPLLLRSEGRHANFGEVHNDHLQIMAVVGFPGYALLIAFLVLAANVSFGGSHITGDMRSDFARSFSFPFALAMCILMLAQFPLELASTLSIGMYVMGLTLSWSNAK